MLTFPDRFSSSSLMSARSEPVPSPDLLDGLVRLVESEATGMRASILILDAERRTLHHGVAPNLPAAYCRAIDGVTIGPSVGSCGTAAWRREIVIVTDIANDPLWADFRAVALEHGLAACWSTPIFSSLGAVLGTFAMYYTEARAPRPADLDRIDLAARMAAAIIEREDLIRTEQAARADAEAARRSADEASRAKSDFLAVMSHELRTPLNAIGGYADLLALGIRGPVNDDQLAFLHRIQSAQRAMLRHINDVLTYAKLEAGHVSCAIRDVGVGELFSVVEPMIAPQVVTKQLRFESTARSPTLTVRADPEKTEQVLLNLLSNAIKFTPPGGVVALSAEATIDDQVAITVRDTGIGIAPEQLASVFDPFVQAHTKSSTDPEGTGLGLAISRDLVRAMGGELTADSAPGAGSCFRVTLPRSGA